MLIDFTIKNYRSFKNEVVLSAETGERLSKYKDTNTFDKLKIPVLKNLMIFGPNGAGKSQIFNALRLMQSIVINGGTRTVTDHLPYIPFKFDDESAQEPTLFEVRFEKNGIIYEYGFSYNEKEVVKEQLSIRQGKKEKIYFEFHAGKALVFPERLGNPDKKLRKNALFLFEAQEQNDEISSEVYKWFVQDLVFIDTNNGAPNQFLELMKFPELKHEMVSFLNFADFNISDIHLRKVDIPQNVVEKLGQLGTQNIPQSMWQLYTVHKSYDNNGNVTGSEELPLGSESLGTQKLFVIVLAMIFSQINHNGKTILIDEFDDSLHSELSEALVKIFNSTENGNQYIISTHNFNLLDAGIRVDQIYFVEKDFMGHSQLKSAFDFTDSRGNARRDAKFAKKYIQGQYGAVPVIDTEGLIETLARVKELIGDRNGKKEEE